MSEHTPGPWRFSREGDEPYWHVDMPGPCGVRYGFCNAMVYTTEADARLIAAAPELLAACNKLVATLEGAWAERELAAPKSVQCQLGTEVRHAKAAIAKAEGRDD
jgi:hypothetical protein